MPGLELTDPSRITSEQLGHTLRGLRSQDPVRVRPLLNLALVTEALRIDKSPDCLEERERALQAVLAHLSWEALQEARGAVGSSRPEDEAASWQAKLGEDFGADCAQRQAWSAVYHRFFCPFESSVEKILRLGAVSESTFRRRRDEGIKALAVLLRAKELKLRQRSRPQPYAPAERAAAARLASLAELVATTRARLMAGEPDALDLPAKDWRLATETACPDLDAYRLRQALHWSHEDYRLDRRFVSLSMLTDLGEETQGDRFKTQQRCYGSLDQALAEQDHRVWVLLGPPGAGKSTLLRNFELETARAGLIGETERLTYFISLSRFGSPDLRIASPPADPMAWLCDNWALDHPHLPPLSELLAQQRLVLLLDALNEMPHRNAADYSERVSLWRDMVITLSRRHPGNRVIFSCRSLDYSAPLSSEQLRVPQLRIEPLDDEQVQQFLRSYCPKQAESVWEELRDQPQLVLFRSPFLLKMLADRVVSERRLPKGRAQLFTSYIRGALIKEVHAANPRFQPGPLLTDRERRRLSGTAKWTRPFDLPAAGLVEGLSGLAYGMQDQHDSTEAAQIRIDAMDALALLMREVPELTAETILHAGNDLGVLDEDLASDQILFRHQLLQEYFAARRLARAPRPELVQSEWRAAAISPSVEELVRTLPPAEPLPALPTTGWEETMLLASAMAADQDSFVDALGESNLALAGRCAAQPESRVSEPVKDRLRWALVSRSRDPRADLRARIAAGEALGDLGDPRFKRCVSTEGVEYLLPPMVRVPGGRYWIGSDEGIYPEESPRHQVHVSDYWIGQFPVTNVEYACFIRAGGYEDSRWWDSPAALKWKTGELPDDRLANTLDAYRRYRSDPLLLDQHLAAGTINDEQYRLLSGYLNMEIEELLTVLQAKSSKSEQSHQPRYWLDERFANPAQPVVGVSWYESRAYSLWLSEVAGMILQLPTEAQWEVAASKARSSSAPAITHRERLDVNNQRWHLFRPSPVGVFPHRAARLPIDDMIGNVLEYTSTITWSAFPYPYDVTDGRESANSDHTVYRVARGGCWNLDAVDCRVQCRYELAPITRSPNVGFRLSSQN